MHRAWVIILAFGVAASAAVVEESDLPDPAHHGHRHVDGDSEGHHHGDADDRHETPDSPCHHHETRICTGHGPELAVHPASALAEPETGRTSLPVAIEPGASLTLHRIFHIPIS